MIGLLAVRAIDLAIFGTLGGLWVVGATFIYVHYRWILRRERMSVAAQLVTTEAATTETTAGRDGPMPRVDQGCAAAR
ncbi:MAG: hypothetical protein JKY37_12590 [Nannocystaceae bacterium]|nr:hypothetical protein [Nannocystaceae bacterium]